MPAGLAGAIAEVPAQDALDGVLRALVEQLRGAVPEQEILLGFTAAARTALHSDPAEPFLADEVDEAVRGVWGLGRGDAVPAAVGDRTGVGLLVLGADRRVRCTDEHACRVLLVGPGALIGRDVLTIVDPRWQHGVDLALHQVAAGVRQGWCAEVGVVRRSQTRPMLMAAVLVAETGFLAASVTELQGFTPPRGISPAQGPRRSNERR